MPTKKYRDKISISYGSIIRKVRRTLSVSSDAVVILVFVLEGFAGVLNGLRP